LGRRKSRRVGHIFRKSFTKGVTGKREGEGKEHSVEEGGSVNDERNDIQGGKGKIIPLKEIKTHFASKKIKEEEEYRAKKSRDQLGRERGSKNVSKAGQMKKRGNRQPLERRHKIHG